MKVITLRLDEDEYKGYKKLAEKERRGITNWIRWVLYHEVEKSTNGGKSKQIEAKPPRDICVTCGEKRYAILMEDDDGQIRCHSCVGLRRKQEATNAT